MIDRLFIYGAGGFGKEVLALARTINDEQSRWNEIYFVDDNIEATKKNGIEIISFDNMVKHFDKDSFEIIVASGEPAIKKDIYYKIQNYGLNIATLIHPKVAPFAYQYINVSPGVIIAEGVILTSNIKIKKGVVLNINCTVGHDVKIGEFSTISPGCNISGCVVIGNSVYVGSGSNIRDEITIGDNCVIGMGSVVLNDVESNSIAFGNPAKRRSENTKRRVFK
jgi:sugar O-acyltransferase (sialic acid O-acetyltransferase NeuD family)